MSRKFTLTLAKGNTFNQDKLNDYLSAILGENGCILLIKKNSFTLTLEDAIPDALPNQSQGIFEVDWQESNDIISNKNTQIIRTWRWHIEGLIDLFSITGKLTLTYLSCCNVLELKPQWIRNDPIDTYQDQQRYKTLCILIVSLQMSNWVITRLCRGLKLPDSIRAILFSLDFITKLLFCYHSTLKLYPDDSTISTVCRTLLCAVVWSLSVFIGMVKLKDKTFSCAKNLLKKSGHWIFEKQTELEDRPDYKRTLLPEEQSDCKSPLMPKRLNPLMECIEKKWSNLDWILFICASADTLLYQGIIQTQWKEEGIGHILNLENFYINGLFRAAVLSTGYPYVCYNYMRLFIDRNAFNNLSKTPKKYAIVLSMAFISQVMNVLIAFLMLLSSSASQHPEHDTMHPASNPHQHQDKIIENFRLASTGFSLISGTTPLAVSIAAALEPDSKGGDKEHCDPIEP